MVARSAAELARREGGSPMILMIAAREARVRTVEISVQTARARGSPGDSAQVRPLRSSDCRDRCVPRRRRVANRGSRSERRPLFEVVEPAVEHCLLTYRADLRTSDLDRGAYLEMWCRLPGRGEFFSKGANQTVSGTTSWSSREVPFYLKAGQRPDLIRLNLAFEGAGTVWIRNVEVLRTPLR